jgi:hypothetical protein
MISSMIGALSCLVVDCPDPRSLAGFYESLLGLDRAEDSEEWVTSGDEGAPPRIAFQQVADFVAPTWGAGGVAQQMHIDVLVQDLDVAQAAVLALRATLLDGSDEPIGYRVFADPVGHPFCLVTPEALT